MQGLRISRADCGWQCLTSIVLRRIQIVDVVGQRLWVTPHLVSSRAGGFQNWPIYPHNYMYPILRASDAVPDWRSRRDSALIWALPSLQCGGTRGNPAIPSARFEPIYLCIAVRCSFGPPRTHVVDSLGSTLKCRTDCSYRARVTV